MKNFSLCLLAISTLALTGCIDRATADARLLKGCKAAIEAFLPEGDSIKDVESQTIKDHFSLGKGHRHLELDVRISDGYHGRNENHACIFFEEFGFANMSHRASIYQLNFQGRIIGQQNYEIQGSLEDMTKLTDAVDEALR